MKYIKRKAESTVMRFLKAFPVLGITGRGQSGKSTFLRNLLEDYKYVTFDDIRKIQLYEDDQIGFIKRYSKKVIFDDTNASKHNA